MRVMESPPGAQTVIDGKTYLYFVGTSYYGLQGHPDVIEAACEATRRYGLNTATSRAGLGNNPPTLEVEERAAAFFGDEAAFYFVSGYAGNGVLLQGLRDDYERIFVDELAHFSVLDGIRLAGRPQVTFAHRDPEDLARRLREELRPGERPLVITDGVFPSIARLAPAPDYVAVLSGYAGAILCLDDAHGVGVLGANGRGTYEHFGLPWGLDAGPVACLFAGTLSKAFGGQGGIVTGSRALIARLKASSGFFNGASQPAAPAAAATAKGLEILAAHPEMRERLWANAAHLKQGLRRLGLPADDNPLPIASIVLESAEAMAAIQQALWERGMAISHLRGYSGLGPEGALRIAVFSTHTPEMIDRLLGELDRAGRAL